MRRLLAAALAVFATGAFAHPHSARECREGGDFIRNAALARDAGASRAFFIGKLEEDFTAVRAFPPELRWFVHNAADEDFLRAEVYAVFDDPHASERHRDGFLERCARRAERVARGVH
jgi:hypothetical protein